MQEDFQRLRCQFAKLLVRAPANVLEPVEHLVGWNVTKYRTEVPRIGADGASAVVGSTQVVVLGLAAFARRTSEARERESERNMGTGARGKRAAKEDTRARAASVSCLSLSLSLSLCLCLCLVAATDPSIKLR